LGDSRRRLDALCQPFVLSRDFDHFAFDPTVLNYPFGVASQLCRFGAKFLGFSYFIPCENAQIAAWVAAQGLLKPAR